MKRTVVLFILLMFFGTGVILITGNQMCHRTNEQTDIAIKTPELNLISGEMLIEKGSQVLYRKSFAFDNQAINKPALLSDCSLKSNCQSTSKKAQKCCETPKIDSSFAFKEQFGQEEFSTFIGRKDLIVVEDTTVLCYDPSRIEQFVPVEANQHSAVKTADKRSVLPVFNTYRILKKKLPDGTTMKVIFLQTVINSLGTNVKG